jgi:hypothetical protein
VASPATRARPRPPLHRPAPDLDERT